MYQTQDEPLFTELNVYIQCGTAFGSSYSSKHNLLSILSLLQIDLSKIAEKCFDFGGILRCLNFYCGDFKMCPHIDFVEI